ncbi:hypothetical protein C7M71_009105 [Peterkaempfera bronchialis]|uniref:NlpC/P60 domain-containing protein n=1 Tax=Peterkaempfera bronchialis TaxID=2126346 RepID=A0A345SV21_9ACTN|nr:hypothetical protein C7M71_009105 [Peterkaempfera bronchialis]
MAVDQPPHRLPRTDRRRVGVLRPGAALPRKEGWDGSRYWFKRSDGWHWTSHYSVYLKARSTTGTSTGTSTGASTGTSTGTGTGATWPLPRKEGWDGTRYWFKRSDGWHWTSHYSVYLKARSTTGANSGANSGSNSGTGTGTSPVGTTTVSAGATASAKVDTAVRFALAQLGKPYYWGGNGPVGYDCSGLVQQAFLRAGRTLPRVADQQYGAVTPITAGQARYGDLLFWSSNGRQSGIHHVAIHIGGGKYVEAPRPGLTIRISAISAGNLPTFYGRP